MDAERWQQVAHLYDSVLERQPGERAAFLAEQSAGDEDLRREVESLLAHDSMPVVIDRPMLETAAAVLDEQSDLKPGALLGPYRIDSLLAVGGMGQVYRAIDTRLNRTVAVKVLPKALAGDPQFRARFDREAHAIATLTHPHICTLYDIGQHEGVDFLVMEYLEGETLAARLEKGRLSVDQALSLAVQIADALAAAHRQGIVHRDLKPGNIILTRSGAKLVDFGLAKPAASAVAHAPLMPTIPPGLTARGTILGTLQYMAPEQLEGKEADARTDIFAFGAVLYQMLTGKNAFEGKSHASLIGAIMHAEPAAIAASQPLTPPALDRLVKICLTKEPDDRWQSARDVAHELHAIGHDPGIPLLADAKPRRRLVSVLATLFGISVAAVAVLWVRSQGPNAHDVRFMVAPPAGTSLPPLPEPIGPAISPDGLRLVFHIERDGEPFLAMRSIDAVDAHVLSGTEGARFPFWSPDGRAIAFFAGGKLKRMNVSGGPVEAICDAGVGFGGTWNRDDVIIFAPSAKDGLYRVSAGGGQPIALTSLKEGERYHQRPQFLPDSQRFLYFVWPDGVYLGSLDGGASTRVLTSGGMALYSPSGHLLFVQGRTIVAQQFDPNDGALDGDQVPIGEDLVLGPPGGAAFSVSETGVLAYAREAPFDARLSWVDRAGRFLGAIGPFPFADFALVELSPTGTQIAMESRPIPNADVWLFDIDRRHPSQLTFAGGADRRPIWSPDGQRLAFVSSRQGAAGLYQKVIGGEQREELLLPSEEEQGGLPWPSDWSSEGIVYEKSDPEGADLWMLPLSGDRKPYAVVRERGNQRDAKSSPDGRWLAYSSNESGRFEALVQNMPGRGVKWRISTGGGSRPVWRHDGKELFFVAADGKLMAVSVEPDATNLRPGVPQPLFQTGLQALGARGSLGVLPNGERFLLTIADDADRRSIVVVSNWTAALKQ